MAIELSNSNTSRLTYSYRASPLDNIAKFTIACWIRPVSFTTGTFPRLIAKESPGGYLMYFYAGDGRVAIGVVGSFSNYIVNTQTALLSAGTNKWQHVAGYWDGTFPGTTSNAKIWINGTPAALALNGTGSGTRTSDTNAPLTIGNRSAADRGLPGGFADAAIWSAELSDAEVAALAKGFSPKYIAPQSLEFYAPLVRHRTPVNLQFTIGTETNVSTVSHPNLIP